MAALRTGDLVLLSRKRGLDLMIIAEPPRDGWLRAVTPEGKARRFPADLAFTGPVGRADVSDQVDANRSALEKARHALESRRAEVDLVLLREITLSDPRAYPLGELAELIFESGGTPEERGALLLALHGRTSGFDAGEEGFTPLDDATILARQQEAEEARREEEEAKARAEDARRRKALEEKVLLPELKLLLQGRGRADRLSEPTLTWLQQLRKTLVEHRPAPDTPRPTLGGGLIKLNDENHALQLLHRAGMWDPDREDLAAIRNEVGVEMPETLISSVDSLTPSPAEGDDLTAVPTFTIDGAHTQDLDDAISIEPEDGGHRVWVHIADVERWIAPGTPLDDWGRTTGESLYLPERVYHLLPEPLVRKISLDEGCERWAVSLTCHVTGEGEVRDVDLRRTRVVSDERLDYDEVDRRIANDPAWRDRFGVIEHLQRRRERNGARVTLLPDLEIKPDPHGKIETRVVITDTPAHRFVAELMIFFNEQVAIFLRDRDVPAIFKTQPPADGDEPVFPDADDPLFFPRIVRMLRPSVAGLDPGRHTFMGVDAYVQATSPIRRYADLVHQRQIVATLAGETPPYDRDALQLLYPVLDGRSGEVRQVERRRRRYWLLRRLNQLRGDRLKGVVSQIRPGGRPVVFFPQFLQEFPLLLPPDFTLEVGDQVYVTPKKVDPIRGGVWAQPA